MKKFFILLMVVLMLAGLTFSSFAGPKGNGDCVRDKDGTGDNCQDPVDSVLVSNDCPNPDCPYPDDCVPIGDQENKYKGKR